MLNKTAIQKLLQMPDERMMAMLRILLAGAGINTGDRAIDEKTVRRIRALLTEVTDEDLARFSRLAECYRNGG